jgi:hypothetical protein
MSISVTGQVRWVEMGTGTWSLIGDNGRTYELLSPPTELTEIGEKVKVTGQIREGVMTIAMIGPVLAVDSFEVVK